MCLFEDIILLTFSFFFSRESLIARTLEDISIFDRPKAEAEVDKFLMDAEMVSYFISRSSRLHAKRE
jgi:hypothetical protein